FGGIFRPRASCPSQPPTSLTRGGRFAVRGDREEVRDEGRPHAGGCGWRPSSATSTPWGVVWSPVAMVTLIGSAHKTTRPRPRPHPSIGDAGGGSNVEIPSVDLGPRSAAGHGRTAPQEAAPRRLRSRPRRW